MRNKFCRRKDASILPKEWFRTKPHQQSDALKKADDATAERLASEAESLVWNGQAFSKVCMDPGREGGDKTSAVKISWIDPAAIYKDPGSKATNPKDAIGALKAKVSVVPANVIFEIGLGMTEGMVKYGRHNYRGCGVRASVYYDASMGHLMDWWEGEDTDPDSGLSHVTKALASLVVLRDAMMQDKLRDDRPPRSKVTKRHFNPIAEKILQSHPDKNPHHWTIADDITEENPK